MLLRLEPGCQTMHNYEVVYAIQKFEPDYSVPIYYTEGFDVTRINAYSGDVEEAIDCL